MNETGGELSPIAVAEQKQPPTRKADSKASRVGRNRLAGVFRGVAATSMVAGAALTGGVNAQPDTAPGRLVAESALYAPAAPAPQATETNPPSVVEGEPKPSPSNSTETTARQQAHKPVTTRPAIIPDTSSISLSTPTGVETARMYVEAALGPEGIKVLGGKVSPEDLKVGLEALSSAGALVSSGNHVNQEGLSRLLQGAIQKERLEGMAARMAQQQEAAELNLRQSAEADRLLGGLDLGEGEISRHAREAIMKQLIDDRFGKKVEEKPKTLEEVKNEAEEKAASDKMYKGLAVSAAIEEYEAAAGRKNPTRVPLSTYERELIQKYVLRGENLNDAIRHATRGNIWRELIPAFFKAVFKNIMKDSSSAH